ncbi:hypothetical protein BGZ76_011608 [Entomortierella beljakovae]|nr:hypothetical protein BGZ76_011608 [Entomortierella beljakovae]
MMHPLGTGSDSTAQQGVFSDYVNIASVNSGSHQKETKNVNRSSSSASYSSSPTWVEMVKSRGFRQDMDPKISPVSVGGLTLYSANMDPETAMLIQKQQATHNIKYLIPDLPVQLYGRVQRHPPSWGLDRIDQRTDKVDGLYHYPESSGQNVTIYIIDTGVNIEHKDFQGRAQHGPVFLPGSIDTDDKNGHGTFVAAVAAGSTYGVAKKAQIVSLKALDDAGAGRLSNILAAIEWVVNRHVALGPNTRSIINLSLGAERNEPTNDAIQEAMKLGVHFSIAAGNDGKDACQFSPASTPGAMTVGATDRDDTIASYSNFGPCVAIYAPGSSIVSAWAGSKSATHIQSGTSMASPHVAGLMALLLSEFPMDNIPPKTMNDIILKSVTRFSINGQLVADSNAVPAGWPDLLTAAEKTNVLPSAEFHGKELARNLVFVGQTSVNSNDTDIVDPPSDFNSMASTNIDSYCILVSTILTITSTFVLALYNKKL